MALASCSDAQPDASAGQAAQTMAPSANTAGARTTSTKPAEAGQRALQPAAAGAASSDRAAAVSGAGMGAAGTGSVAVASAGVGAAAMGTAGASAGTGPGAAGSAAGKSGSDDSDAGTQEPPASVDTVTIIAQASFAPAVLMVDGADCAAGSCSVAVPADGKLTAKLRLERTGGGKMPVLAGWKGCGTPTTTFFPSTPRSTDYILKYETAFSDLKAGSTCTAEIVEGGWLVFAGDMSLQIVSGEPYCVMLQVSPMGVNASCFAPPGTAVSVKSDLPRWNCVIVSPDGSATNKAYPQAEPSLTSVANELVNCVGAAE